MVDGTRFAPTAPTTPVANASSAEPAAPAPSTKRSRPPTIREEVEALSDQQAIDKLLHRKQKPPKKIQNSALHERLRAENAVGGDAEKDAADRARKHDLAKGRKQKKDRKERFFQLTRSWLIGPTWLKFLPAARIVYLDLELCFNGYSNGHVLATVREIMTRTGLSQPTVCKALEDLQRKGFIKVARRGTVGPQGGYGRLWQLTRVPRHDKAGKVLDIAGSQEYLRWSEGQDFPVVENEKAKAQGSTGGRASQENKVNGGRKPMGFKVRKNQNACSKSLSRPAQESLADANNLVTEPCSSSLSRHPDFLLKNFEHSADLPPALGVSGARGTSAERVAGDAVADMLPASAPSVDLRVRLGAWQQAHRATLVRTIPDGMSVNRWLAYCSACKDRLDIALALCVLPADLHDLGQRLLEHTLNFLAGDLWEPAVAAGWSVGELFGVANDDPEYGRRGLLPTLAEMRRPKLLSGSPTML